MHNKEKWSIEHIFPQKIKNSGDKEKYKKYIKSYLIDLISYLLLDKESNQSQENLEMVLNTLNNEINDKNEIDSIINDINNSNKEYKIDDIINKIKTVIENNNLFKAPLFSSFKGNIISHVGEVKIVGNQWYAVQKTDNAPWILIFKGDAAKLNNQFIIVMFIIFISMIFLLFIEGVLVYKIVKPLKTQ